MSLLHTALISLLCCAGPDAPDINPCPRAVLTETLKQWSFDQGSQGWVAEHSCRLSAGDGLLKIEATDDDPFLHCPIDLAGGRLALRMRARCRTAGGGTVFWTTDLSPQRGEDKKADFALTHDGLWREYVARFDAPGRLRDLRLDPGQAAGTFDVDWIRLVREEPHPLTIDRAAIVGDKLRFEVTNHRAAELRFSAPCEDHTINANATIGMDRPIDRRCPLEAVSLELRSENLPPVRRTVFLHHPQAQADWIVRPLGEGTIRIARNGTLARIERDGTLVAFVGPLVHYDGKLPELEVGDDGALLRFQGEGISVSIAIDGSEVSFSIDSRQPCEGPVVRAVGSLEQGLLAGLEYLGRGERSSSRLDIETAGHLRFAPDRLMVTMPLMSFVTDRSSVAMTWADMELQPVYATPNFFDSTTDHRMALRGKRIEATVRIDRVGLEETILWAVNKHGLPPVPEPPRTRQQQWEICLKGLNGPLRNEDGWGHCVQANWARRPCADMASTIWRLTGKAPGLPRLVPGGAHVANGTIYFVTGRAQQWLDHSTARARGLMRQQQPDGSFRYDGEYGRGHFENTASGVCARPAAVLLEHAYVTGDRAALAAGLHALDYMKRFRTPRGAQVWEVPLHTPDQLASAYLVWAYVRGYELTGNEQYLKLARKWALSGIPFTYLWGRHPIMLYSTPPVFGATHWRHSWFGLPVQWVGGVYAYALTMLASHERSLDWNHLARGILVSAEQQQYPDGPHVGLLPDSFDLRNQQRRPADINPCALVSLRMVLDGQLDFLSVATDGKRRIAAPFPVTLRDGKAVVQAAAGVDYQVIVDGSKIVDVASQGEDVVPLP